MSARTPILPVALLVAAIVAIALPGDPAGLLLLTPALVMLLPLLVSAYPGEKSAARLASWFARALRPDVSRSVSLALAAIVSRPAWDCYSGANGSRGPPLLSHS